MRLTVAIALVVLLASPVGPVTAHAADYDFEWTSRTSAVIFRLVETPGGGFSVGDESRSGTASGSGTLSVTPSLLFATPTGNVYAYDFTFTGAGGGGGGRLESPGGPAFMSFPAGVSLEGGSNPFGANRVDGFARVTGDPLNPSTIQLTYVEGGRCSSMLPPDCSLEWSSSFDGFGVLRSGSGGGVVAEAAEPVGVLVAALGLGVAAALGRRRA